MTTLEATIPSVVEVSDPNRPDVSGYLAIHDAMRAANRQLVTGLANAAPIDRRRAAAVGRWFRGYSDELRTHHHIEDDLFFPQLLARVPDYATYADGLADDHHRLDELIDAIRDAIARWGAATDEIEGACALSEVSWLAMELDEFLAEHLAIEDADVIPLFQRHFDADEYAELERGAGRAITLRQALFTVPWYMATAEPTTAERTRREAPLPLRIIYVLTRRRYARLVERAFGA